MAGARVLTWLMTDPMGTRLLAGSDDLDDGDHCSSSYDPYAPLKQSIDELPVGALIATTIIIMTLGSLAAGAGIGGGGLFVPMYSFILLHSGKAAVPLSKCTILGAAIGNFQVLSTEKHPVTKQGPVIDYETSSFMQAGELLGVVFGVLLNMVLTETEIMIFLVILLTYNAYNTLKKGIAKWNAETKAKEGAKDAEKTAEATGEAAEGGSVELTVSTRGDDETDLTMNELESDDDKADDAEKGAKPKEINAATEESNVQFPKWAYAIIISMTLYTVLYASMKSPSYKLLWPCDDLTAVYWLWYFTPVIFLGGAMVAIARILRKSYEKKRAAGWDYTGYTKADDWMLENAEKVQAAEKSEGDAAEAEKVLAKKVEAEKTGYVKIEDAPYYDMVWTDDNLMKFPKTALLAGLAAGLLGIGGGMVLGPLFIEIGMQPVVAKSSCAFMILWTGLSGVAQYWMADKLGWQLALYFIVVGYCSGQIGQRGLKKVIKATGRESIVILLLGSIIGLACVSMVVTGSISISEKAKCGGYDFWTPSSEEFQCEYFEDYYYSHRR